MMKRNKNKDKELLDKHKIEKTEDGDLEVTAEVALQSENELLEKQISELKNKNLMLLAEIDNQRKRFETERIEFIKYRSSSILEELLPSIQLFEQILKSTNVPEQVKNWLKGFEMIHGNIDRVLHDEGVIKIHPKHGDKLDLSKHEVLDEKYEDNMEEGIIVSLAKEGYMLRDRLLIPAKVIVSTKNKKEIKES